MKTYVQVSRRLLDLRVRKPPKVSVVIYRPNYDRERERDRTTPCRDIER